MLFLQAQTDIFLLWWQLWGEFMKSTLGLVSWCKVLLLLGLLYLCDLYAFSDLHKMVALLLRYTERLTSLKAKISSGFFYSALLLKLIFIWSCGLAELCIKYSVHMEKNRTPQICSEWCELSLQARSGAIQFSTHSGDRAQRAAEANS